MYLFKYNCSCLPKLFTFACLFPRTFKVDRHLTINDSIATVSVGILRSPLNPSKAFVAFSPYILRLLRFQSTF